MHRMGGWAVRFADSGRRGTVCAADGPHNAAPQRHQPGTVPESSSFEGFKCRSKVSRKCHCLLRESWRNRRSFQVQNNVFGTLFVHRKGSHRLQEKPVPWTGSYFQHNDSAACMPADKICERSGLRLPERRLEEGVVGHKVGLHRAAAVFTSGNGLCGHAAVRFGSSHAFQRVKILPNFVCAVRAASHIAMPASIAKTREGSNPAS